MERRVDDGRGELAWFVRSYQLKKRSALPLALYYKFRSRLVAKCSKV